MKYVFTTVELNQKSEIKQKNIWKNTKHLEMKQPMEQRKNFKRS